MPKKKSGTPSGESNPQLTDFLPLSLPMQGKLHWGMGLILKHWLPEHLPPRSVGGLGNYFLLIVKQLARRTQM